MATAKTGWKKVTSTAAIGAVFGAGLLASVSAVNMASAMSFSADGPTLEDIQKAIDTNMLDMAIKDLKGFLTANPKSADGWNLLGYSYRMDGKLDLSWDSYERALTLDPDHLGALEYLGELYITQGNMDQANAQLHKLMVLCPSGCEAFDTLKKSIDGAN